MILSQPNSTCGLAHGRGRHQEDLVFDPEKSRNRINICYMWHAYDHVFLCACDSSHLSREYL
jgi:hypothetical protein